MSYVTVSSMRESLGEKLFQYLNVDDSAELESDETLLKVVNSVNAEVDNYLRARYTLPLKTADEAVNHHARAIAALRIASARGGEVINDALVNEADRADKFFKAVQDGNIFLQFPAEHEQAAQGWPSAVQIGSNVSATKLSATRTTWNDSF